MPEPIVLYTNQLKKRMPEIGFVGWNDERDVDDQIDDVVMGALLTKNRVISGGLVSHNALLVCDYEALVVEIAGSVYRIAADSLTLTAATSTPEQVNWIYVNDSGVVTVATVPPSGDYIPLALADTDDTTVLRIADLRPFSSPIEGCVENLIINPDKTINQRDFDGVWTGISVGAYGYDRWRRGVTASTIEQPILNTSIHAGKHTLSWDGGGSGDVTQSAASVGSGTSPLTVTLADQIQTVVIVPETATNVRFVEGEKELPVIRKTAAETAALCAPYAWRFTGTLYALPIFNSTSNLVRRITVIMPQQMVQADAGISVTVLSYNSGWLNPPYATGVSKDGFYLSGTAVSDINGTAIYSFMVEGEI